MKKQEQGYITCYLALTLGIMISFIFTLFEAVRVQTIRMETEGVMDIALFSIFGEFHRELLEQYDLFFIDTSYGEGIPKIKRAEEHLQYYMNQNFEKEVVSKMRMPLSGIDINILNDNKIKSGKTDNFEFIIEFNCIFIYFE